MTDLVPTNATAPAVQQADLFAQSPRDMVKYASEVAAVLKDVVVKQKLAVRIGPNEYVKAEGWSTLGCLLGILPREKTVEELEDGSFMAIVELYNVRTGSIVGQGSALCGSDEKRWGGADRFARRSMAITRATGKAYRLGFSWILTLAGYQPTPAEEMTEDMVSHEPPRAAPRRAASIYTGTTEQQKVVESILKKEKVPEEFWPAVDSRLRGKPSTELKAVIAAVRAGEPDPEIMETFAP